MTRQETARILAVLAAHFPNRETPDPRATLESYYVALDDVPYPLANAAVAEWLKVGRPFFPAASEIRSLIAERQAALPTPEEAWELVMRRMRSTIHGMPVPPWDAPREVLRAVDAMGGMYALRMSEKPGADRAHFLEIYGAYRARSVREANLGMIGAGVASGELRAGS